MVFETCRIKFKTFQFRYHVKWNGTSSKIKTQQWYTLQNHYIFWCVYMFNTLFWHTFIVRVKDKKKTTQAQTTSKKQKNNNKPSKSKTKQKTPLKEGYILLKHHSQIIGVYGSWKFDTSEEIWLSILYCRETYCLHYLNAKMIVTINSHAKSSQHYNYNLKVNMQLFQKCIDIIGRH